MDLKDYPTPKEILKAKIEAAMPCSANKLRELGDDFFLKLESWIEHARHPGYYTRVEYTTQDIEYTPWYSFDFQIKV